MKLRKLTRESDFDSDNLINHSVKHLRHYKNDSRFANINSIEEFAELYDKIADSVSRHKVSKSDSNDRFVGFITKDNRYIKYDRKYDDFVVYRYNQTITMHKKSDAEYDRIRLRDFYKELPYNDINNPKYEPRTEAIGEDEYEDF